MRPFPLSLERRKLSLNLSMACFFFFDHFRLYRSKMKTDPEKRNSGAILRNGFPGYNPFMVPSKKD